MRYLSHPIALLVAFLLTLAVPVSAQADSLVYVKGGDVWLSQPDGQQQTRLTNSGGFKYASQSEGGVIAASQGSRVVRLSRRGEVQASYPTSVGENAEYGPYATEISPDGKTIAYEYYIYSDFWGLRLGVAYIDVASGNHLGESHTGWAYPAWIDDQRLIHSGPPTKVHTDVMVRAAGEPNNTAIEWFSHPEANGLRDGDIARDGSKLAFVGGENEELMLIYRRTGEVGVDAPEYCYHYLEPNGKYADPAISPDGTRLAWQENDGIHVGPLPDLSAGCSMPADEGGLILPGAIYPDWGPADVPGPITNPPEESSIRPVNRPRLPVALNRGVLFSLSGVPSGTRVKASIPASVSKRFGLGRKARVVASGTSAGERVRITFGRKVVKKLRRARTLPLTVVAGPARTKITLRR